MFIFESLYSAMAKGWNKEELTQIVHRLNQVNKDLNIDVYRSNIVVKDFEDFQKDKIARETKYKYTRSYERSRNFKYIGK